MEGPGHPAANGFEGAGAGDGRRDSGGGGVNRQRLDQQAAAASSTSLEFHRRCGQLVTVSGRKASRNLAVQEFNHGLVFSSEPLQDDRIFEVRIDKKVHSWSGSIEVGVVSVDPEELFVASSRNSTSGTSSSSSSNGSQIPSCANELRRGSWIMSGNTVLKDGHSLTENYGSWDLDGLQEGDRVGVVRTSNGDLVFYVNGVSQSAAAADLPKQVWAVVDMYGKCAAVTLTDPDADQQVRIRTNALINQAAAAASDHHHHVANHLNNSSANKANNLTNTTIAAMSKTHLQPHGVSGQSSSATSSGCNNNNNKSNSGGSNSSSSCNNANTVGKPNNKIRFHDKSGALTRLSNKNRTAERRRPFDEFNHGVVLTHRPLVDNEMFELRIDRLVDKWSGSVEVGVTSHDPDSFLGLPETMTNQRSGTMMMSGRGILTNGKGTRGDYGDFNLDELSEGDRVGVMRKSDGTLRFYINGLDQGVAATRVPAKLWGVVDLYGKTVKVTIVDRDERDEQNLITRRNVAAAMRNSGCSVAAGGSGSSGAVGGMVHDLEEENRLLFHHNCGSHAAVVNRGSTAHRPNADDDFNFGVVLTNRPLKPNEVFEVKLDKMVTKWAGSIEIGVTTHSPTELDFPSTMTNVRSGTWMMTGNGVMHNGTTVIDDYGHNLDKLKVGDRVAVVRKDNCTVHFFVNSEDQGPAATNVPERVYGVIDLYGQAAQATIIDLSDYFYTHSLQQDHLTMARAAAATSSSLGLGGGGGEGGADILMAMASSSSAMLYSSALLEATDSLRFHHLHGRNARISNGGMTASRPHALGEFNDSIVISNRPLKDGELFEIVIERMVERWSGSIEAGVTLIRPEDLEFPNTMTDIDYDTWMLSGSAVMRDGQTVISGYVCDLDTLSVGSRLGMMRQGDGTLRYTIDGQDQGVACEYVPPNVYAVIDLYGQCAQVSIIPQLDSANCSGGGSVSGGGGLNTLQTAAAIAASAAALTASAAAVAAATMAAATAALEARGPLASSIASSSQLMMESEGAASQALEVVPHRFLLNHTVELSNNNSTCARKWRLADKSLVFLSAPLVEEGLESDGYEIRLDDVDHRWAGSLKVGLTAVPAADAGAKEPFPGLLWPLLSRMGSTTTDTVWLNGTSVLHNQRVVKLNYTPSLSRLLPGDRVGLRRRCLDGCIRFTINGEDLGRSGVAMPAKSNEGTPTTFFWPVIELAGSTKSISVVSSSGKPIILTRPISSAAQDQPPTTWRHLSDTYEAEASKVCHLTFHDNHGKNVILKSSAISSQQGLVVHKVVAERAESYNQGLVVTSRHLARGELFQVKVTRLNDKWSSGLSLGILGVAPDKLHLPVTALGLKRSAQVISGDGGYFENGRKVSSIVSSKSDHRGPFSFESRLGLVPSSTVADGPRFGIMVDTCNMIRVFVDGEDWGPVARCLVAPTVPVYGVLDLYGKCEEAVIVPDDTKGDNRSTARATSSSSGLRGFCDFLKICKAFKASLSLPDEYFVAKTGNNRRKNVNSLRHESACFCKVCRLGQLQQHQEQQQHGQGQQHLYGKCGQPPKDYALPAGWVLFPLNVFSRVGGSASSNNLLTESTVAPVKDTWHRAYCGTKPSHIRKILDNGELVAPGESRFEEVPAKSKASKEDDSDTKPLVFSPTLRYIGKDDSLCPASTFVDKRTQKGYHCRVAFQIAVHPGSYKIGPPTAGQHHHPKPPDPHFKLDETEWLTKERGNIVINGLLVKLWPGGPGADLDDLEEVKLDMKK